MTSTEDLNQRIELLKCLLGLLDASLEGLGSGGFEGDAGLTGLADGAPEGARQRAPDGVDPWARILGNSA